MTECSPPASIAATTDRIFSIAVNSITSRPLKAVVKNAMDNDVMVTSGDFLDILQYEIESLDENAISDQNYNDIWLSSGGHLAMWGVKAPFPGCLQQQYFK